MGPKMPLCITPGVFQLNETMLWYDGCVLRGFLPLEWRPPQPPEARCTSHIPPEAWARCRPLGPHSSSPANLSTSVRDAWGRIASGRRACSCSSCLSPLSEIQSRCTFVYSTVKITAAALSRFWKYLRRKGLNSVYGNQNRQCVAMMCVPVWVIRCQRWMVAAKWAFCVAWL